MKYNEVIKDLKNKIYHPVYLLMGAEPFYIDKVTDYIATHILEEHEKDFNQTVFYGKDADVEQIINASKRYPMMANHQVIIIREAQELKDIDKLIYYTDQPLKSTILVINYKYKKFDKRKKLYKSIQTNGLVFESPEIKDYKLPEWISQFVKSKKYQIDDKAAHILAENLGNDLGKIANELDKLIITLPKDSKNITAEQIEKNIGISKDYNNFELTNALCDKNLLKAYRIIDYFGRNPKNHHISATLATLYYFFSKVMAFHFVKDKSQQNVASSLGIHPFLVNNYKKAAQQFKPPKIARIIDTLREYDLRSKGLGSSHTPDSELMKEMLYKIIH